VTFSNRYGYKRARDALQLEGMDKALRNGLWSLLELHAWRTAEYSRGAYGGYYISPQSNRDLYVLSMRLWLHYFKEPVDQLGRDWKPVLEKLKSHFYSAAWFEAYDFVEFVANNFDKHQFKDRFIAACNERLEIEASAYRFVGGLTTRITEPQELEAVDQALDSSPEPVRAHLQRALELLSDRLAPDYRNSIKESISAVESLVLVETASDKGTLGQLLKKLEDQIALHPALKNAFSSLYGYSSDAEGIRHALLDLASLKFEDAKFFLVVCSAFITFVVAKRAADD